MTTIHTLFDFFGISPLFFSIFLSCLRFLNGIKHYKGDVLERDFAEKKIFSFFFCLEENRLFFIIYINISGTLLNSRYINLWWKGIRIIKMKIRSLSFRRRQKSINGFIFEDFMQWNRHNKVFFTNLLDNFSINWEHHFYLNSTTSKRMMSSTQFWIYWHFFNSLFL